MTVGRKAPAAATEHRAIQTTALVSFNSISTLFSAGYDSLGTYTYTPPGNNVYANYSLPLDSDLVSDATAGGDVSLYFYAADNQVNYLFNARSYASNHPELTLTAAPVPEPATVGVAGGSAWRSSCFHANRQRSNDAAVRQRIFAVTLLCLGSIAKAQVTNTAMTVADAFLATGSPNYQGGADLTGLNFGDAGTLAIAPASSAKGEFQSVIKFNLSNAVSLFNTTYGTNNWTVGGISLELTSNYGTAGVQPNNPIFNAISGGKFVIEWLSNDDWVEGTGTPNLPTTDGVTYNSLPDLLSGAHQILCTNTYAPPGNNVPVTFTLPLDAKPRGRRGGRR